MSTDTQARQPKGAKVAGVSAGGRFAESTHSSPSGTGLASPPTLAQRFVQLDKDALGIHTEFTFIDYDEQLHGEQIDQYLSGDVDGELENTIMDLYDDSNYDNRLEAAKTIAKHWGTKWEHLDEDDKDELLRLLSDDDTSNPVPQLAKNTHSQVMRASLGGEFDATSIRKWAEEAGIPADDSHEMRAKYLLHVLNEAGVTGLTDEDLKTVDLLVSEGPDRWHESVRFDVIWYGDIRDAALGHDTEPRKLTFGGVSNQSANPKGRVQVVLLDTVNGSGYSDELTVPVTLTLTPDNPARLDSGGASYGYGWDDTAGIYPPAFAVAVTEVPA